MEDNIDGIGIGQPCIHCGTSFGDCWGLDAGWCCEPCRADGWSRHHAVEHEVPS